MGNSLKGANKSGYELKEAVFWEVYQREWMPMQEALAKALEERYAKGGARCEAAGFEFDLVRMTRRGEGREELIRRRVVWSIKKKMNEHFQHPPSDEEVYILNYISGITQQKDENIFLNKVLKTENEELTTKINETKEIIEINHNTWESAQSVLKIKENEVSRMKGVVECYTELKRELEGRREEVKLLDALNSDMRMKLSQGLLTLESQMVSNAYENEDLFSKAKTLTLDLQEKDKELAKLKPTSPKIARKVEPAPQSKHRDAVPVSPRTEVVLPTRLASPRHSMQPSPLRAQSTTPVSPPKPAPTSPRSQTQLTLGGVNRNDLVSPKSVKSESRDKSDSKPGRLKLTHSSPSIKPLRLNEIDSNDVKESQADQRQYYELREKLISSENKLKTKEVELETARATLANLKKELEFIEVIKMQKKAMRDSLDVKIKEGDELNETLNKQTEDLIKLEKQIKKIKAKYKIDSSSDTEPQDHLDELNSQLEELNNKQSNLQEIHHQLQTDNQYLKDQISQLESQKYEMEHLMSKSGRELKEKEKKILDLQSPQKENPSSKMLQILRKEAMVEKSKVVTLTSTLKQLNDELKSKDEEIEELRNIIKKLSVNTSPFQKNLESDIEIIKNEIEKEKEQFISLQQECLELKENLAKMTDSNSENSNEISSEVCNQLNEQIEILKKTNEEKDQELEKLKNEKIEPPKDQRMIRALMEESQKMKTAVILSNKELDSLKKLLEEKEEQLKILSQKLDTH